MSTPEDMLEPVAETPMERVRFHEGSIGLPPGYEDRSTNLFVPANTEAQPNLSIARDWLHEGEALPQYVERQLGLLKARMPGYKLLGRCDEALGQGEAALAGLRIDASYKNGQRLIHQRQAAFLVGPRRALILTASSARPFSGEAEVLWRQWLHGYEAPAAEPAAAEPAEQGPASQEPAPGGVQGGTGAADHQP